MIWARFLTLRTRGCEDKEEMEVYNQVILLKLMTHATRLIEKCSTFYTVCRGKWDRVSRKLSYNGLKPAGS